MTMHECFALSREPKRDRLTEIIELLRLDLNSQEERNMIKLITNNLDSIFLEKN